MVAAFHFDRSWTFTVPPTELWAAVSRTEDFPRWWSWLRIFDADGLEEGGTARCVVRGPIPYTLTFSVAVQRLVPEKLVETRVSGDLEGPARLEVAPHPVGCEARLSWDVELRDPLLRAASRVARPLMEWGHDWVVESGVREFRRHALPRRDS